MVHHTTTRRRFTTAAALAGMSMAATGVATAKGRNHNFRAPLSGDEEVPPVDTRARGLAKFQLSKDETELEYRLNVANIEHLTMAHIHQGERGENGPVVTWLYPDSPPPQLIEGRFSGVLATGTITDEDLVGPLEDDSLAELFAIMRAEETYVNVHTEAFPAGEVRGQIR